MSGEQFKQYIRTIQRQIASLKGEQAAGEWEEIAAALEGLQLVYEETQTSLEAAEVFEEKLLQQNQQATADYYHYYDLFHALPIAYLVTDANGLILEANQAIAQLLNIPHCCLVGKPLAVFVAEADRRFFRTALNTLSRSNEVQTWEISLCPRRSEPFVARLHVAIAAVTALQQNCSEGSSEALRIAVYNVSQFEHEKSRFLVSGSAFESVPLIQHAPAAPTLPRSLDGLQVLIVDDEADARDFITAVLEAHGVRVTAVATVAAALETLEQFPPDVLVSDIRMPEADGYSLIRKVRELEAKKGWHIPAGALTAYLTEDREKALSAGFEAHLHKLAQPIELIEMVAQLARRASKAERDSLG